MYATNILQTLHTLFSCPDDDDSALTPFCDAAEAELLSKLKEDVVFDTIRSSFLCAAAQLAYADFLAARSACDDCASFRAGDVSVQPLSPNAMREKIRFLRQSAKRLLAPYSKSDFFFRGVRA